MLPETWDYLRDHGFADGDRVKRKDLADRCRELLLEKPVESAEPEEIQGKALIVAELRSTILEDPDDDDVERDLEVYLQQLVGPAGLVQEGLENGYVLCAARVTRKLGNGAGTIPRRGRFVTSNAEAIESYYWAPVGMRLGNAMESTKRALELGVRRQPELETKTGAVLSALWEKMRLELPEKTEGGA